MQNHDDDGFTLIELLVVIIIIGILAAIAVPVYLSQREKGWYSQAVADMRNAAVATESYATEHNGNYAGLDGATESTTALVDKGFRRGSPVSITVRATDNSYCITGRHANLSDDFVYRNSEGIVRSGAPGFSPC